MGTPETSVLCLRNLIYRVYKLLTLRVVQGGVLEFAHLCHDWQSCPTIITQPNLPVRAYTAVSICSSLKTLHSFWAAEHKSPRKKNLSTLKVFSLHYINGKILELSNQKREHFSTYRISLNKVRGH